MIIVLTSSKIIGPNGKANKYGDNGDKEKSKMSVYKF